MIPKSIGSGDLLYALALSAIFAGIFLLISALFRLVITPWRRRREVAKRVQDERLTLMARSGIFRSEFDDPKNIILKICRKSFQPGTPRQSSANSLSGRHLHRSAPLHQYRHHLRLFWGYPGAGISAACSCSWPWASGAAACPFSICAIARTRKARLIEQQMPDAMELLARSLRAGHTLAVVRWIWRPRNWITLWGRNCAWPMKSSAWG